MSKATTLTGQVKAALEAISTANGYSVNLSGVFLFGERKVDSIAAPYLLVNIGTDELVDFKGKAALRHVVYMVEGVMGRSSSLQDLQALHHDIIKALGLGDLPASRPLANGWPFEESAEFMPDQDGSTNRTLTSSITLAYIENY